VLFSKTFLFAKYKRMKRLSYILRKALIGSTVFVKTLLGYMPVEASQKHHTLPLSTPLP
jgi:hypothetical protein